MLRAVWLLASMLVYVLSVSNILQQFYVIFPECITLPPCSPHLPPCSLSLGLSLSLSLSFSFLCQSLWQFTRPGCFCLPLELPISAYCQWKPRKLITKPIMVAAVEKAVSKPIGTHTSLCQPPPRSAHVMPVTWLPGKQLSKSQSDFYF